MYYTYTYVLQSITYSNRRKFVVIRCIYLFIYLLDGVGTMVFNSHRLVLLFLADMAKESCL